MSDAGSGAEGAPLSLAGEVATGITCPRCGGAIWDDHGEKTLAFHCRIGHRFSPGAMLAEHATKHHETLDSAIRYTAEAAALKRLFGAWARTRGHSLAAARLAEEADVLESTAHELERVAGTALSPPAWSGP